MPSFWRTDKLWRTDGARKFCQSKAEFSRTSKRIEYQNETAFNLLEELLTLYIRVRTFLLLMTKFRLSKSEIAKQIQDLSEQA